MVHNLSETLIFSYVYRTSINAFTYALINLSLTKISVDCILLNKVTHEIPKVLCNLENFEV